MKKTMSVLLLMILVFAVSACSVTTTNVTTPGTTTSSATTSPTSINNVPVISGTEIVTIPLNTNFSPMDGITASDEEDGDLTDHVVISGNNLDVATVGTYQIVYSVMDDDGNSVTLTRSVIVIPFREGDFSLADYPDGIDLSNLPIPDRAILMSALEEYLLENVYAGVPLFSSGSLRLYDDRVDLLWEDYNASFGFGDLFSGLTADDSTVIMAGGSGGSAGQFTWRSGYRTDPEGWNHWTNESNDSQDFTDMIVGTLYELAPEETGTSFTLVPRLAAADPVPMDPQTGEDGIVRSLTWEIPIRTGLVWTFDPDTDTSHLPSGYETLDASDFLWTWKYALDQEWYGALSGTYNGLIPQGIKGIQAYRRGEIGWSEVGLSQGTGNSLRIEYDEAKSLLDVLWNFSTRLVSPVCKELLEAVGEENYGTSPQTVASSGCAYLDEYVVGTKIVLRKNPHYPDASSYQVSGWQFVHYANESDMLTAFLAGDLDMVTVPGSQKNNYVADPRAKVVPDGSVWRLVMNAFGTEANRDAYLVEYPESGISPTYVPEPILLYPKMREALFFGVDRDQLVTDIGLCVMARTTLFPGFTLSDGRTFTRFEGTDAGLSLLTKFAEEKKVAEVRGLFHQAVAEAIANGHYSAGTAGEYTVIHLDLAYIDFAGSAWVAAAAWLKTHLEALLVDDALHVRVEIGLQPIPSELYYEGYILTGSFDLGLGTVATDCLCEKNYLLDFSEGRPNGTTMDCGIDTASASIRVCYRNFEEEWIMETWSYDALATALYESVKVEDGVVVPE